MKKRLVIIMTLGALVALFVIPLNPVHSKVLKLPYLVAMGCGSGIEPAGVTEGGAMLGRATLRCLLRREG
jgi:hypothetical protein